MTDRETQVMRLICEGLTAQGIGEALGISSRTVEVHRNKAITKLGARNQTQAAVLFDRAKAADRIEALTAEVRRLDYSTTHTCWDECPRLPCAQRREIEALTAQLAEARESERAAVVRSVKLWALLDDIDTLDDACRGEDDLFRTLTRAAQQKRHAIMSGEEWDAARHTGELT